MSNYEIKIKVDIQKTPTEITKSINKTSDGSFRIVISDKSGKSIDSCEQALLATNYPAIRDALSCHLSEISKHEATKNMRYGLLKKTQYPIQWMEK